MVNRAMCVLMAFCAFVGLAVGEAPSSQPGPTLSPAATQSASLLPSPLGPAATEPLATDTAPGPTAVRDLAEAAELEAKLPSITNVKMAAAVTQNIARLRREAADAQRRDQWGRVQSLYPHVDVETLWKAVSERAMLSSPAVAWWPTANRDFHERAAAAEQSANAGLIASEHRTAELKRDLDSLKVDESEIVTRIAALDQDIADMMANVNGVPAGSPVDPTDDIVRDQAEKKALEQKLIDVKSSIAKLEKR